MNTKLLPMLALFAACQRNNLPSPEPAPAMPPYQQGITAIAQDSLAFVLFAPHKQQAHLIGNFNNWDTTGYKMQHSGDYFYIKIGNLTPCQEYVCQYVIDGGLRIADPYCRKTCDPLDRYIPAAIYPNPLPYPADKTSQICMVVSTCADNYAWQSNDYTPPRRSDLIIYEILLRDFTQEGSIRAAMQKLPYLRDLGVNAVELMPFSEFEGNDSWGYNPSFYFAPDKAYGTPHDYKEFIDQCHQNGIAVIMDMVLNHSYGQSPMVRLYADGSRAAADNPWYNAVSPNSAYSWGYDFNHESPHTQRFIDSVLAYWLREYRVDGFRFDFTKGFTNKAGDGWTYDASRIALLKRMAAAVRSHKSDAIIILEHLTDNNEEKELAADGMLLWGNMNYNVNESTMGYGDENNNGSRKGDWSWASYVRRGWSMPCLVAYMESHDEERIMYKNKTYGKATDGYDVKDIAVGLQRTMAAAAVFYALPGPKMLWQFGELGYDYKLGQSMEDGRLERKPVRWDYLDEMQRSALHDVFAGMFALRSQKRDLFATDDYIASLTDNIKYVILNGSGETAAFAANFDVVPRSISLPLSDGAWRDHFSGEIVHAADGAASITLPAGGFRGYFKQ